MIPRELPLVRSLPVNLGHGRANNPPGALSIKLYEIQQGKIIKYPAQKDYLKNKSILI